MIQVIRLSLLPLLAALLAGHAASAHAQAYPSKTITMVVVLVPGTGMDIIARSYGEKLAQTLGRPVVVENKPGASQILGINALLAAPADGHTLLVASSTSISYNPSFFKKLPYDYQKDFIPISLYLKSPFILVVNPQIPARTALELIQYAKERPGKLNYSSQGNSGAPYLSGQMLNARFGLDILNIPYKDSAQSIADVASGTVHLAFAEAGASQSLIRDGRIRALAVSSLVRLTSLPDVPPLAEAANAPEFEAVSWHVLLAKAGTPSPIVNRLHNEMKRITAEPEIRNRMRGIGLIPNESPSVEAIQKYFVEEDAKWGGLVRKLGLAGTM